MIWVELTGGPYLAPGPRPWHMWREVLLTVTGRFSASLNHKMQFPVPFLVSNHHISLQTGLPEIAQAENKWVEATWCGFLLPSLCMTICLKLFIKCYLAKPPRDICIGSQRVRGYYIAGLAYSIFFAGEFCFNLQALNGWHFPEDANVFHPALPLTLV